MPPEVRTATPAQRQRVVNTLLLAFAADPMMRWLMADSDRYVAAFGLLVDAMGGRAFALGGADYLDDFSAAALWLPPGERMGDDAFLPFFTAIAPSDGFAAEMAAVGELMAVYHPHEPHWYLPLLGVDAARQGQGLGAILLKYALARADREHMPAYLESSNPKNIPFYERHGFEVIGSIQAGSSPPLAPMLRVAR